MVTVTPCSSEEEDSVVYDDTEELSKEAGRMPTRQEMRHFPMCATAWEGAGEGCGTW